MSALDRMLGLLFVPFAGVRTYILLKGTLLLLAFDIWLTRISHGGRYGAGGFNVAHFAWLDAIQPSVSPGLYIAVSMLTAFLCVALALAPRPPRWLFGLAFLLHTWSWAMSMRRSRRPSPSRRRRRASARRRPLRSPRPSSRSARRPPPGGLTPRSRGASRSSTRTPRSARRRRLG